MRYVYGFLALAVLGFMFTFGVDREIARQQYVELADNGDFEKKVEGCIYNFNCNYYTNLLWEK